MHTHTHTLGIVAVHRGELDAEIRGHRHGYRQRGQPSPLRHDDRVGVVVPKQDKIRHVRRQQNTHRVCTRELESKHAREKEREGRRVKQRTRERGGGAVGDACQER